MTFSCEIGLLQFMHEIKMNYVDNINEKSNMFTLLSCRCKSSNFEITCPNRPQIPNF